MTPTAAIERLLTVNRDTAVLILTGIAVFAAISIVGAYNINYDTALRVAAYVFGFGVVATVLSIIISDLRVRAVLGWFLVALAMVWTIVLSISVLFQPGPFPPVYCIVNIAQRCDDVAESIALAEQKRAVVSVDILPAPIAPVEAPPTPMTIPQQQVVVQFAGLLTRDSVRNLMRTLQAEGWNMQGTDGGGERTEAAVGYNEVRYAPGNEADATILANALQALNLTGKPIIVVENPKVQSDRLEVWLSVV
jgi:hypothetical protein